MLNAGLTGGIGSGKSMVAGYFREKGAYVIDFDLLAHLVEKPGGAVWKRIVEEFGKQVLGEDNTINRIKLGEIVFRKKEKLDKLNRIVHPAVFNKWREQVNDILRIKRDAIVISDIPLLIETGWQDKVDVVILVYVPPEVQIERIMKRNGYNREEAEARLNSQMPIDDKISFADFVIGNEGSPDDTKRVVDKTWIKLIEREKIKGNLQIVSDMGKCIDRF